MKKTNKQVNFTEFLSLLSRTKEVQCGSTTRSGNTEIRDLIATGFSGYFSLIVFILIGIVIRNISGPAIVLSILFASIVGLFSGICYAEFGARFKQQGSSYFYAYSSIGEFLSFLTSWSVLLAYAISVAVMGRGISEYIDSIVDGVIKTFNEQLFGTIETTMFASSFDLLASTLVIIIASGFAGLIRDHGTFVYILTHILNIINLLMMAFIVIIGFIYADIRNWSEASKFLPYGNHGVLVATAICFSIFFAFEVIVSINDDASSSYTTPLGIILYIPTAFLATIALSIMITFMVPYYKLSPQAQLVSVFTVLRLKWARYMVAIFGFSNMLLAMIEIIYRMGSLVSKLTHDNLLPSFCGAKDCREVHVTNFTIPSYFAAVLALLFDTSQLIDTLPIGPLLATVSITFAVILVRYTPGVESIHDSEKICPCITCKNVNPAKYKKLTSYDENKNSETIKEPNIYSYRIAFTATVVIILSITTSLNLMVNHLALLSSGKPWVCITLGVASMIMFTALAILLVQPKNGAMFPFMVPFVPLVPLLSISTCVVLMLVLPLMAWMRFLFWLFTGLFFYFMYGVHHSKA